MCALRTSTMHRDCNEVGPHSSLKGGPPKEYAEAAAGL